MSVAAGPDMSTQPTSRRATSLWLVLALALTLGPGSSSASLTPIDTPLPSGPMLRETERTLWSASGSALLRIARVLGPVDRAWTFASHWAVVGTAGNRLLWYRADTAETNLWKLDDGGNYLSHVSLPAPEPGFAPVSITLRPTYLGACWVRDDSQRYAVLWANAAGAMYLELMNGDGRAKTTYAVAPMTTSAPTRPVAAGASLGGLILLTYVTPPGQAARIELRYLEWNDARAQYIADTITFTAALPQPLLPVSVNAGSSATAGWLDQVFFRTVSGDGLLWEIGWGGSQRPLLGERTYPRPASGWLARGHTINPSVCP